MRITQKLLGFLNRAFNKDPAQFLALRMAYAGTSMAWEVDDGTLTIDVAGGAGQSMVIDLSQYTVGGLANFIGARTGFTIPFVDRSDLAGLSALVLIDGSGDQSESNGDHLYGYTSLLWSYVEAAAVELDAAARQVAVLPAEMNTNTADGFWLDYIGSIYGVPRSVGELDAVYGPRIVAEVVRPRGNNKALEMAISTASGGQPVTVYDDPEVLSQAPVYNASFNYDGSRTHNGTRQLRYNLFSVLYAFDLEGSQDINAFAQLVLGTIEKFRDAGTHLHHIALQGSVLHDSVAHPSDTALALVVGALLTDTVSAPSETMTVALALGLLNDAAGARSDAAEITISSSQVYDGLRFYDGTRLYNSGSPTTETLL